jgi:hypothetical protein
LESSSQQNGCAAFYLPRRFGELARSSSTDRRDLWLALAVMLGLAAAARLETLHLLRSPTGGPDEGVYLIVARLLNYGYAYSSFFFDQLSLFPQIIAAALRVGGDTILTGRLTIVLFSLLGLALLAWLALLVQWRAAAPLAILFAVVNPYYLEQSRYTMAEVPCITLLIGALIAVLLYTRSARRSWLVAAAICFSASVLIKPLAVGFGLAIAWWLIARVIRSQRGWGRRARELTFDLALFGCVAVLTALPFLDLLNLAAEFQKTVGFHLAETRFYAPQFAERQDGLISFVVSSQPWLGLALLGAGVAALKAPNRIIPLVLGEIVSAGILLPLPPFRHHYAILVPVLALLAAIGVEAGGVSLIAALRALAGYASRSRMRARVADQDAHAVLEVSGGGNSSGGFAGGRALWGRQRGMFIVAGAFLLVAALWFNDVGKLVQHDDSIIMRTKRDQGRIIVLVERHFKPGEFVISDDPMSVYRAGGLIPPPAINLVYDSTCSVFAGCRQKLQESIRDYPVKAVLVAGLFSKNHVVMRWIKNHFPLRDTSAKQLYTLGVRIYTRE